MKNLALVAACAVAAFGGVMLGDLLDDEASARDTESPGDALAVTRLEQRLDDVVSRLEEQAHRVAALDLRLAGIAQPEPLPEAALRGLVESVLAERLSGLADSKSVEAEPKDPALVARDLLAQLDGLAGDDVERELLWEEIRKQGLMDAVLAELEAQVAAAPGDADLRVELGLAYLQKIQEVGNGPLAGIFATKADEQFDAVLEQDPQHWDARFTKAVSLSFWPPIFGKQNEAIANFAQLAEQQKHMQPDPKHADTWLLLGNMYQQMGKHDEAMAAWTEGYELHPDANSLAEKLLGDQ
ncbi:MAG: hypothetical protein DHS20C15_09960 [Planctomycetota bacterium]|nr:MAG: hypothetical protein DHS20C15_09960 [Planctomycetota bacterium]